MTITTQMLERAAVRLRDYLVTDHWTGKSLSGPDPGVRFNARIYRFAKSYLRALPWDDDRTYAQAQKYWIQANLGGLRLGLFDQSSEDIVRATAEYLRGAQTAAGYWEYPNPEWAGRIATVEGNYATVGMLYAAEAFSDPALVEAAIAWHDYAVTHIGFQRDGDTLAINYFGNLRGGRVPNNSASAVRAFAMIAAATGDERFLETVPPMIRFMAETQLEGGELPYAVRGQYTNADRYHFLCYQYNAFEYMNLVAYQDVSGDDTIEPILSKLATYLESAFTRRGTARYNCHQDDPEVVYYTIACSRALRIAQSRGEVGASDLADRSLEQGLARQRGNGSFPYSFGNYGILHDLRSYPRYQAMILAHLVEEIEDRRST